MTSDFGVRRRVAALYIAATCRRTLYSSDVSPHSKLKLLLRPLLPEPHPQQFRQFLHVLAAADQDTLAGSVAQG